MTEAKKSTSTRASKAKTVVQDVEEAAKKVEEEVVTDVKAVVSDVKAEAAKGEAVAAEEVKTVEAELGPYAKELAGKSEDALRELHLQAIYAEDAAKRELYVLRLRAANMATTVESKVDEEIVAMKQKVAEAAAWLAAIEKELSGKVKDIYDSRF